MTEPTSDGPRQAGAFYDAMWQRYAHLDAASPAAFHRRRLLVQLARRNAPDARRILDVGCGQGALLDEVSAVFPGAKLHGADVSERILADCRTRLPGAELFLIDLTDPTFDARHSERFGAFDLVICSEVVEHIDSDALALAHLRRLLSTRGTLLVSVPGGRMSRFDEAIGHRRHYDVRRLRGLLEHAGFQAVSVFAWGFPFQNLYRTAVRVASRAALPESPRAPGSGPVGRALDAGYRAFGMALKPLFYLNVSRWGEQLFAAARAP